MLKLLTLRQYITKTLFLLRNYRVIDHYMPRQSVSKKKFPHFLFFFRIFFKKESFRTFFCFGVKNLKFSIEVPKKKMHNVIPDVY